MPDEYRRTSQIYPNMEVIKKTLILVGNKPPYRIGLHTLIDSFDYVLRIGRMNNLGVAGRKINGIYIEANNVFKYIFHGGENKDEIKKAQNIFMHKYWYEHFREWDAFLTKRQYESVEIINDEDAIKAIGFERPTSAVLMLAYLLNSRWKEHYDIHITCLDVEGRAELIDHSPYWNWHKGAGTYEENYLKKLIDHGIITRVRDE